MKHDWTQISSNLSERGWTVVDGFVDHALAEHLAQRCRAVHADGQMHAAGIGKASDVTVRKAIRSDWIVWLTAGDHPETDQFLLAMEALRQTLNRELFLGLDESEHHFALYRDGAFYRRHLDRFRNDDRRVLSSILYLNHNWHADDGGMLRIFVASGDGGEEAVDIAPAANRLVLFLSDQIEHEVLPTNAQRLSLTGWFKRRA